MCEFRRGKESVHFICKQDPHNASELQRTIDNSISMSEKDTKKNVFIDMA